MRSQYSIKLAVYLVSSYFDDLVVSKVCECLLRRGTLPWRSIVQFTELNPTQVKNSLLVLTQHNFVQAFSMEQEVVFGEAPKIVTQYMALFDNIIHHMSAKKSSKDYSNMVGFHLNQILDRQMETSNQNGDTTFVEKKETAKIMFKLWKDNYLHMEVDSHNSCCGRLISIPLGGRVLDEMYHANYKRNPIARKGNNRASNRSTENRRIL